MKSRRQAASSRQYSRRMLFIAAGCLLPVAFSFAADPPVFVLDSVREDQPVGPLVHLAADGTVQVGGAKPVRGTDVVALHRQGLPPPLFPHDRPHALFVGGDRVPGKLISIANDKARFLADLGAEQEIAVPLSSLAAVWLTDTAAAGAETKSGRRTLAEKRRQDLVQLTNGDTSTGTVIAWAADGPLRLDVAGQEVAVPRDRVQGLVFSTELAKPAKPRSAYRQIVLLNGARLSVRTVELVGDDLRATTLAGAAVRIPLRSVAAINVFQSRAVYLSDLKPLNYEHLPYLGVSWPLGVGQSAAGGDLRLGGGTYDKGIGVHSRGRITYALPTGAKRFETVVGLDDLTGRSGSVQVQVLADGRPLLDSPLDLTGTDPPRTLRLALPPAAHELTLTVDFGRGGDVQDNVDWADARVITAGTADP
jgi:NPCBM/NEW2 domain